MVSPDVAEPVQPGLFPITELIPAAPAAATDRGLPVDIDTVETASAFGSAEVLNRVRTMRDTQGFYPTSEGEANEGFSLLSFLDKPGATAKHLHEIQLRQINAQRKPGSTADPAATIRAITQEYAGYAARARLDLSAIQQMGNELKLIQHVSKFVSLQTAGVESGIAQLTRFLDLRRLADEGVYSIPPFVRRKDGRRSALDPYTRAEPDAATREHLDRAAASVRIWQAEQLLPTLIADQKARKDFWVSRLVEAKQHMLARPVAASALAHLGVEK